MVLKAGDRLTIGRVEFQVQASRSEKSETGFTRRKPGFMATFRSETDSSVRSLPIVVSGPWPGARSSRRETRTARSESTRSSVS